MHIFKQNNRTSIFKRFCWLLESPISNSPIFPPGPVPIPPPKHHRWDWNYEGRVTPEGSVEAPPHDCGARPSHPTMGTKTKWMSFWKWRANTMATLTYIKWTHFISLSILSFQDFVLRSLCSMKVSHPTTACFGMLDVHCHESEDRIAWLCQ